MLVAQILSIFRCSTFQTKQQRRDRVIFVESRIESQALQIRVELDSPKIFLSQSSHDLVKPESIKKTVKPFQVIGLQTWVNVVSNKIKHFPYVVSFLNTKMFTSQPTENGFKRCWNVSKTFEVISIIALDLKNAYTVYPVAMVDICSTYGGWKLYFHVFVNDILCTVLVNDIFMYLWMRLSFTEIVMHWKIWWSTMLYLLLLLQWLKWMKTVWWRNVSISNINKKWLNSQCHHEG